MLELLPIHQEKQEGASSSGSKKTSAGLQATGESRNSNSSDIFMKISPFQVSVFHCFIFYYDP